MARKPPKLLGEFQKFALRGNVFDMAIGVIIGTAFTAIVNSIVNDLIMPLISLATGNINELSSMFLALNGGQYKSIEAAVADSAAVFRYGSFLQAVVNFLIIAFSMFIIVRTINKVQEPFKAKEPPPRSKRLCPYCITEIADEATRCPHCTSALPDPKSEAEA